MPDILVLEPGTAVLIAGDLPASITSVAIGLGGYVSYRVACWDGRERREYSLHESEVTADPAGPGHTKTIGFRGASPRDPAIDVERWGVFPARKEP